MTNNYKFLLFVLLLCLHVFIGCKKENPNRDDNCSENAFSKDCEDINRPNVQGWTPIFVASFNDKTSSRVKLLIQQGADVNYQSKSGETPLHMAVKNGNIGIVRLLVENNAKINKADNRGRTPLFYAAQNGKLEIARYLIEQGADIWIQDELTAWPFDYALGNGHNDLAELLVSETDITETDNNGHTLFHKACIRGDLRLIRMLFGQHDDLNVNQKDLSGSTPLDLAIRHNPNGKDLHQFLREKGGESTEKTYLEMEKERLPEDVFLADLKKKAELGEDLNNQNEFRTTLLHKASELGYLDAVNFLLSHNVDVNLQNKLDMTALELSMAMGHYAVAKRLIEIGTDLNIVGKPGMSPLCYATVSEDIDNKYNLMQLLIEKGADINGAGTSEVPLFLAISTKDTKALKLLIEKGADVNHINRFGDTPLFQAFMSKNTNAFEILLRYGANVELDNSSGHSVLEYISHIEDDSEREQYQKILKEYFREK